MKFKCLGVRMCTWDCYLCPNHINKVAQSQRKLRSQPQLSNSCVQQNKTFYFFIQILPPSFHNGPHFHYRWLPTFPKLLWWRANTRNVSLLTLYNGQFALSTQLITLNYPVNLSKSITFSISGKPLEWFWSVTYISFLLHL